LGVPGRLLPFLLRVLVHVALILHLYDLIHVPIDRTLHCLLVRIVIDTVVLRITQLVAFARTIVVGLVDHLPLSIHRLGFVPRVQLIHVGRTHYLCLHIVLIPMVS